MDHGDHDHDYGGEGKEDVDNGASSSGLSCSICLDLVLDNGLRSRAKLQCGHEFHLDCIGSAFNMKGAMQCPNCRQVEKGQWLYATGSSRSVHDHSIDDWFIDEDFYDLSYTEMPYRVHWCPFGELERIGSAFELIGVPQPPSLAGIPSGPMWSQDVILGHLEEQTSNFTTEVESPSTTYHDLRMLPSLYPDLTAPSSVAHSYVAYVGPVPPSSTRSNDNAEDHQNFNHHWNGLPGHNEIFNPHPFPAINIQYHSWARHSNPISMASGHINGTDPASVPPLTLRSSSVESDSRVRSIPFPHPIPYGHGSRPTAGSSVAPSMVPHPSGQTRERVQISHPFHPRQQSTSSLGIPPPVHGIRRFDGPRGLPAVIPAPPQPDHSGGFFIIPPSNPSGHNPHETEIALPSHFHGWERERAPPPHFQPLPFAGRDASWGSFYQNTPSSDSGNRVGSFWRRHLS